jgi:hypothetical protein
MSQTKVQLVSNIVGNVSGGASFTGIVTATSFNGSLTGTASTASFATTSFGLSGTPNITVGVVTASSFIGNVTGNATGLSGTPNITVGNVTGAAATFTNLTVNGTQTIINTTELNISDKTVGIASTSTPSDSLADGAGIVVYGTTNKTLFYDNTRKGWDFNIPLTTDEVRFYSVAEKHVVTAPGATVDLVYNGSSANIGLATNPTADLTLNVIGIPTSSDFNNHTITFSVFINQTGTARSCTAVTLNGFPATIRWSGGSLKNATTGVTTSNGMDIYSFTGINTIGSASTTSNYYLIGSVNGGYR